MKMEQTERSETSAYKIQTPGNYPKESVQHTEHGKSLKLSSNIPLPKLIRSTFSWKDHVYANISTNYHNNCCYIICMYNSTVHLHVLTCSLKIACHKTSGK